MNDGTEAPATTTADATSGKRKRWLTIAIGGFVVAGIGYGAYWYLELRNTERTDDAYVNGNVVQITPQVAGTVVAISTDDTQFVKAGEIVVELDQEDAKIALAQAEARLGKAVREVRGLFATTGQLGAMVDQRATDVARAAEDLGRRERLSASGAVSGEDLQHARDTLAAARSAEIAARREHDANRARIDGRTVANHPDVLAASAQVRDSYLELSRTRLPAPVSGFVAKRAVQLGQRVAPGAALLAVVPLDQLWVEANFKEPQLANLQVGQPATLKADVYGGKIVYHGTVVGFGAGTGSAFALLPAQNATGNWIKIVQRVPVRIALDPAELAKSPLRIGLSMLVDVDTRPRTGVAQQQRAAAPLAYKTQVYEAIDSARRIRAIIAANL
jgi:membrane fusion protein (multidrug efflux system)